MMKRNQKYILFCAKILSSGFGSGFVPGAPGTVGALFAAAIWGMIVHCMDTFMSGILLLLLIALFTGLGVWASNLVVTEWGEDPSCVVVDEMVGTWIALCAIPDGNLVCCGVAVALFRFFDIVKPFGIRKLEQIPGGWGIMLDDILSGGYTFILLCLARFFWGLNW